MSIGLHVGVHPAWEVTGSFCQLNEIAKFSKLVVAAEGIVRLACTNKFKSSFSITSFSSELKHGEVHVISIYSR